MAAVQLRVWNSAGEWRQSVQTHAGKVLSMATADGLVWVGHSDGRILVFNDQTVPPTPLSRSVSSPSASPHTRMQRRVCEGRARERNRRESRGWGKRLGWDSLRLSCLSLPSSLPSALSFFFLSWTSCFRSGLASVLISGWVVQAVCLHALQDDGGHPAVTSLVASGPD